MMASNRGIHIMRLRRRKSEMDCFRFAAARLFACVTLTLTAGVVADAARAETVRVGIIGASSDAPFFIADAKGYFSAEGLALELMSFDSGAKMVAPLGTGDLDAGGGAVSVGLYNAVKRGVGLKVVADKVHYGPGYGFASLLVRRNSLRVASSRATPISKVCASRSRESASVTNPCSMRRSSAAA
jgi:NitT/TauT family transport system substrate-binding protein